MIASRIFRDLFMTVFERFRKEIGTTGLICILLFLVSPSFSRSAFAEAALFPVTVTDTAGNKVLIKEPPVRIISLAAGTTEVLFSLGLGDRIVAVTDECNYPEQAKEKACLGNLYLNYEKIVNCRPDLVVLEGSLRSREIPKLKSLGIPLLVVCSDNYQDFLKSLQIMGQATGANSKAEEVISKLQASMKSIADSLRHTPPDKRPRVFVEIWNRPLMTAGGDTFINYVIESAGGVNVFSDLTGFPQINPETLILRDPEVIILTTSKAREFESHPIWKNIRGVRLGRVHEINPDILVRPSLRLFDGCLALHRWFFPGRKLTQGGARI